MIEIVVPLIVAIYLVVWFDLEYLGLLRFLFFKEFGHLATLKEPILYKVRASNVLRSLIGVRVIEKELLFKGGAGPPYSLALTKSHLLVGVTWLTYFSKVERNLISGVSFESWDGIKTLLVEVSLKDKKGRADVQLPLPVVSNEVRKDYKKLIALLQDDARRYLKEDGARGYPKKMEHSEEKVVRLSLGFVPEAAISGGVLLQDDWSTYISFNANKEVEGSEYLIDGGQAVIEFKRCFVTKFGYPNDEAQEGHPLYGIGLEKGGYGIYEVFGSSWKKTLVAQNKIRFPDRDWFGDCRHFIITFHDSTFECLADDFTAKLDSRPFEEIMVELLEIIAEH